MAMNSGVETTMTIIDMAPLMTATCHVPGTRVKLVEMASEYRCTQVFNL